MATFAKSTFNAAIYSASRPTYPPRLFDHIFQYYERTNGQMAKNGARRSRALDLGCGTGTHVLLNPLHQPTAQTRIAGQATAHLIPKFSEIICADPSSNMLRKAQDNLVKPNPSTRFRFVQCNAEDLRPAIPDTESGSVDLLIAAQACHWFDWTKVWPEVRRVLSPGGVAAFWVYGEMRLPSYQRSPDSAVGSLIADFWQTPDRESTTGVGAYFERPGRTVLERLLVDVPPPCEGLGAFERVYFTGTSTPSYFLAVD